ncbi:alpha/beta hydrolase [Rhodopirellula halodulae]|uniref:alpha/beta hydrolase n=1 Tax=Rhodopirellula halodulae TaxID=2894198 RepID=UPI001E2D4D40|nr:alpha/beta hydrolase [Rhodopirellula sp. JC737]MCC9655713.1 alpha/beta hydrolase [Rhodopirellula sp. JC737]
MPTSSDRFSNTTAVEWGWSEKTVIPNVNQLHVMVWLLLSIAVAGVVVGQDDVAAGQSDVATGQTSSTTGQNDQPRQTEPAAPLESDPKTKLQVRQFLDQRYSDAEGKAGLLDVHVPLAGPNEISVDDSGEFTVHGALRPVVLVIHGGGWALGDKWTLRSYCDRLAELGFVVANMNYRLAPQHQFPCQVDDVRDALLYIAGHAEAWKADLNRVGLFGYSAGGHLSSLVGVLGNEDRSVQMLASQWPESDPRWDQLPKVAAVCAGGPPCDFRGVPEDNAGLSYFLGGTPREVPDNYLGASPTAHVSPGDPPTQLIHGEKDLLVPIVNSEKFAEALRAAGVTVSLTVIENQGHMMTLFDPLTKRSVKEFFLGQLMKP